MFSGDLESLPTRLGIRKNKEQMSNKVKMEKMMKIYYDVVSNNVDGW